MYQVWVAYNARDSDGFGDCTDTGKEKHARRRRRKHKNAKRETSTVGVCMRVCSLLQRLWKPLATVVVGVCLVYTCTAPPSKCDDDDDDDDDDDSDDDDDDDSDDDDDDQ